MSLRIKSWNSSDSSR